MARKFKIKQLIKENNELRNEYLKQQNMYLRKLIRNGDK